MPFTQFAVDNDDDAGKPSPTKFHYVAAHHERKTAYWRPLTESTHPKRSPGSASWFGSYHCLNRPCNRAAFAVLLLVWIVSTHFVHPISVVSRLKGVSFNARTTFHATIPHAPGGALSGGICARITSMIFAPEPVLTSSWLPRPRRTAAFRPCSSSGTSLLVVLIVGEHDANTRQMCARATDAAAQLQNQQTLGCLDFALIFGGVVATNSKEGLDRAKKYDQSSSHKDTKSATTPKHTPACPGIRAFNSRAVHAQNMVAFWAVSKDKHRNGHLQPAALEKMMLAAYGEDADVASIEWSRAADDDGTTRNVDICIRPMPPNNVKPGRPPRPPHRRFPICHSKGAPVLLRVPTWLPPSQLEVWMDALLDAIRAPMVSAASFPKAAPSSSADDALSTLFCQAGRDERVGVYSLREKLLLMAGEDGHRADNDTEVTSDMHQRGKRRWCDDNGRVATGERRLTRQQHSQQQHWAVIADAYIARATVDKGSQTIAMSAFANVLTPEYPLHRRQALLQAILTQTAASPPPPPPPPRQPGFLIIVPWLEHGGADQFNVNLARELTRIGVGVVVVTTLSSAHPTARDFYAITPDVFHLPDLVACPKDTARVLDVLVYLIASRGVEVVMVSHSALGYRMLPSLREALHHGLKANRPGRLRQVVRLVDFVHLEEMEWGQGGYAAMSVAYAQHLDHTFAASEHVAAWMRSRRRHNKKQDRTSVAYIGVDTQLLRPMSHRERLLARHELFGSQGVTINTPIIAYLARMVDQKLPELYFEIIRQLRDDRRAEFASVAIGGGPRGEQLRANLSRLRSNLNRVEYSQHKRHSHMPHLALGMLDHATAVRVLAASDILILPSRNEGVALAVYEAMALGVTPVVSAVGGQCELVTAEVGACVHPHVSNRKAPIATSSFPSLFDTATAFVDELEGLITSPELLSKRRAEARRRVDNEFNMHNTLRTMMMGLGCGRGGSH